MTDIATRRNLFSVLAILVIAAGMALFTLDSASANGNQRVIAVTGVTDVDGQQVVVHIAAVVNAGQSDQSVATAALAAQGARALTKSEYALTNNPWDQFGNDGDSGNDFVVQRYNDQREPEGGFDAIQRSRETWNVAGSNFAFQIAMASTGDCPSLVAECRGAQTLDGNNDIAWMRLNGQNTLAVTWSATVNDEKDVAFNTKYKWFNSGADFDIETVALHEFGHVVGLGHSTVSGSIMEAIYDGERRVLHQDDIDGAIALYGASGGGSSTPTPTATATAVASVTVTATAVATATPTPGSGGTATVDSIGYSESGGKNNDKDLRVTLNTNVAGAAINIVLSRDGNVVANGSGTTGSGGDITFRLRNADNGIYTTEVTGLSASGYVWDGITPDNSHLKD